jgi:hypothetical protein
MIFSSVNLLFFIVRSSLRADSTLLSGRVSRAQAMIRLGTEILLSQTTHYGTKSRGQLFERWIENLLAQSVFVVPDGTARQLQYPRADDR